MTNGNIFVPDPPPFKIYQMEISYGCNKNCIKMDILGIKCSIDHACLLKKFFSQIVNPMEMEKQIDMFVPTRAVHLIGLEVYTNLLRTNNEFLQSITMVPMGDFQHKTLDIPFSLDPNMDIDQTTLYELIHHQTWCIHVKWSLTPNKVIIVTTKRQVTMACKWTDKILSILYNQHISDKIDVTVLQHLTPWQLDKPTVTAASMTYVDKLKQRMICTLLSTTKLNLTPMCPHTQTRFAFDEMAFPPLNNTSPLPANSTMTMASTPLEVTHPMAPYNYQAELQCITNKIETTLKDKIETALM